MDELPKGWASSQLSELVVSGGLCTDGDWVESKDQDPDGEIRLIQLADIGDGMFLNKSSRFLNEFSGERLNITKLNTDDILVARMPKPLGRACMFPKVKYTACTVVDILIFRSGSKCISHKCLMHFINSPQARVRMEQLSSGSTRKRISGGNLKKLNFPIPPEKEQKRIANKIDALFVRSENTKETLDSIPALLEQYRQSILIAAFRGDLTKDWREQNSVELSKPLKALRKERLALAKTDVQKDKINNIYGTTDTQEFSIPATWKFVQLRKLAPEFSYGSSKKSQSSGAIPVLRMGNIQRGEINWEKLAYSSDEKEIDKYKLEPNDILFNRTNSPELVGKTAIYRGEKPAVYAGYLIRVRPYEILNPEYLNYCLGSQYGRDYCQAVKSDGVSQSNINAQKLASFKVPLCCPEEQLLIVEKIREHFSFIERIGHHQKEVSNQISSLKESILAKAFRGGLVPQDPRDEPAYELLKRIKVEREQLEKEPKAKKNVARNKPNGRIRKMIIPVIDALKQFEKPLSSQQLLSAAGYPNNADTDQIEQFFLDIRQAINNTQIEMWREDDQDYFRLAG